MIEIDLVPLRVFSSQKGFQENDKILCAFYYDVDPPSDEFLNLPFPLFWIPMVQLGSEAKVEVWSSPIRSTTTGFGDLRISASEQLAVFGIQRELDPRKPMNRTAEDAYKTAFQVQKDFSYPYLLRTWNYFPRINQIHDDMEVYKSFCLGRHTAFENQDPQFQSMICASSALGTRAGHFTSIFLMSKESGLHIENPRQVSAYRYPRKYGPKSPTFARATLKSLGQESMLFLSGTASIVGHETQHAGNSEKQLQETFANIKTMLRIAREKDLNLLEMLKPLIMKIYIRNLEDFPIVQSLLELEGIDYDSVLMLNCEICRRDLLLEIEGIWSSRQIQAGVGSA